MLFPKQLADMSFVYTPTPGSFASVCNLTGDTNPVHRECACAQKYGLEDVVMPGMQMLTLAEVAVKAMYPRMAGLHLTSVTMRNMAPAYPSRDLQFIVAETGNDGLECEIGVGIFDDATKKQKADFRFTYSSANGGVRPEVPQELRHVTDLTSEYPVRLLDACELNQEQLGKLKERTGFTEADLVMGTAALPFTSGYLMKRADPEEMDGRKIVYMGFGAKIFPFDWRGRDIGVYCVSGAERRRKKGTGTIIVSPVTMSIGDKVFAEVKTTLFVE
ncbi:hypothetical protein JW968_01540 [Candidatus Woesearchaeota archaeon]|nr:hypothetical protein [Candidatus Woesearchaeota archaeon]